VWWGVGVCGLWVCVGSVWGVCVCVCVWCGVVCVCVHCTCTLDTEKFALGL